MFNGYYQSFPSGHIVLFDAPMDLEWNTYANSLESLFLHELTHAVSLNTRDTGYRVLHRIFGTWATPALLNAPLFMVEGVTVSFESLSGFGRANDPLTRQVVRQAIHENKFPTPFQASGVHDLPGQNGNWYEYGGLFSAWLQQTYGMEKYAELWQGMGRDASISVFVYRSDYFSIFRNVYGIDFLDAWNAFRESLALDDIEENPGEIFSERYHFFSKRSNSISALAAGGNSVYMIDGTEEKIRVYDTLTARMRSFYTGFYTSYDLDVSADGATLLVSGYHLTGDRYHAAVIEHRTSSGWKTGRNIAGLYKARYFRDGVIGLRSELHNTCIVYEDFNGTSEVLFRGNDELVFSGPQAVDDERIVFVASRGGVRSLMLYNYGSGELFRIEHTENTEDSGGNGWWHYMRGLGVSDGKIFFSHNADDRMYKLAAIDLDAMQAVFSTRDFSGGVFSPVATGGEIYYRGDFWAGDGVLRFPETAGDISGTQAGITLVMADAGQYGMAGTVHAGEAVVTELPYTGESKRYFGIRYINPFKFWLPWPLVRITGTDDNFFKNLSLDGGGLISIMADPTGRNTISTTAYADIRYGMAAVQDLTWQTTVPGFPLTMQFSDMVMVNPGDDPYRDTRAGLGISFMQVPGRWGYVLSLGGTYVRIANYDGGESAYTWGETGNAFFLSAGFSFSNHWSRQIDVFGTGLTFGVRGLSVADSFEPRAEGVFQASVETRFPLRLTLYGAYDALGMNLHGTSRTYGDPLFAETASAEYPHPGGLNLNWLAGAEASLGLFSLEIQKNLSHIYFNRFFGTLSIRNAVYDSHGHPDAEGIAINDIRLAQSLVLRLGLMTSIIPIKLSPFFIEPNIWGSWNFSNTITGKGSPFSIGFGFGGNIRL